MGLRSRWLVAEAVRMVARARDTCGDWSRQRQMLVDVAGRDLVRAETNWPQGDRQGGDDARAVNRCRWDDG